MPKKFEDILDICLDRLARGEDMETLLREYPEHADRLCPLLETASQVKAATDPVQARAEFKSEAKQRLMVQARAQQSRMEKPRWFAFMEWQRRWAFAAVAVILVVVLGGGATVAASTNAMPDDFLYPVKLAVERTRVAFAGSDMSKAKLEAKFAARRVEEIAKMSEEEKWGRVESTAERLSGHLARIGGIAAEKRTERAIGEKDARKLTAVLAYYATDLPLVLDKALEQASTESKVAIARALDISEDRLVRAVEDLNVASGMDAVGPVRGIVRAIRGEKWIVGSQVVNVDAASLSNGVPEVGTAVEIDVTVEPDGVLRARNVAVRAMNVVSPQTGAEGPSQTTEGPQTIDVVIETPIRRIDESSTRTLDGIISRIADNAVIIGNYTLLIDKDTAIQGELRTGLRAKVRVSQQNDGSLLAHFISVDGSAVGPPDAGEVKQPEPTANTEDEPSVQPVPTSTRTPAVEPSARSVTAPTVEPVPSPSVIVTPEPVPAKTAEPTMRELKGTIERMGEGFWVVGDQTVSITNETQIEGDAAVGRTVTIRVEVQPDGSLEATGAVVEAVGEDDAPEQRESSDETWVAPPPDSNGGENTVSPGDNTGGTDDSGTVENNNVPERT